MPRPSRYRVLVVCGGNTCRSPVLAFLLRRELYKIGSQDVQVSSAGASEKLSMDPRYAGGLNAFAKEALLRNLGSPKDANLEEIMLRAHEHQSRGLSRFSGEHFDLILLVDNRYRTKLKNKNISATQIRSTFPRVPDKAFSVWDKAGRPSTINGYPRVFSAYMKQTVTLRKHAIYFAFKIQETTQTVAALETEPVAPRL